jgi:DNA modification methylase
VSANPKTTSSPRRRGVRDRITGLVRVPAGDLQENPKNWRRHPARQRAALRGLLKEIGYADALLARREGDQLVLIDGHLRRSLDPKQLVPVLVLDVTEAEADTLLATLDPLAGLAEADPRVLQELLASVETSSAAVQALLDSVARGAGLPVVPFRSDPDWIPEPPRKPRTRPGDLWILGKHRLLCGDACNPEDLKRLMDGERADVLWTDPPYGVSYVGKTKRALTIENDQPDGLKELLDEAFSAASAVLKPGARLYVCHPAGELSVVFGQAFLDQGWRLHQTLVWVKDSMVLGHGDYHYRHEPILYGYVPERGRWGRGARGWYGGNAETSVIEVPRPAASTEHPTAKPVELICRCLRNSTRERDRVLDPFVGSGSTLMACELFGRQGYALELDPAYCDVIIRRWEAISGVDAQRAAFKR